jgi:Flp pilus assembly protein TadD
MDKLLFYLRLLIFVLTRIDFSAKSIKDFFDKRTDNVKDFCKRQLENDPTDYHSRLLLAGLYRSDRNYKEAITQYNELIIFGYKDSRVLYGLAMCLFGEKQYDKSKTYFNAILDEMPNSIVAINHLGRINTLKGNYSEAIEYYIHSIDLEKNDSQIWENLAYCYYNVQEFDKSYEAYRKAFELDPNPELEKNMDLAKAATKGGNPPKVFLKLVK